jgi:hypothetical protein
MKGIGIPPPSGFGETYYAPMYHSAYMVAAIWLPNIAP